MDQMRQWVMTLSLACITTGILQQFVGAKKQVSCIKLVFALYILVTALSPISGFSQFIETAQIPSLNMEENSFDTQQEILNITQQTLETEIEQELYSNGIQARATVILSANKQDVTIEKVEIYTSANESEVRSCLLTYFETEVEVDVYST